MISLRVVGDDGMEDNTDDVLDNWEDEDADVSSGWPKIPYKAINMHAFFSRFVRITGYCGAITQVLERRMEERQKQEKQKQQKKEK